MWFNFLVYQPPPGQPGVEFDIGSDIPTPGREIGGDVPCPGHEIDGDIPGWGLRNDVMPHPMPGGGSVYQKIEPHIRNKKIKKSKWHSSSKYAIKNIFFLVPFFT